MSILLRWLFAPIVAVVAFQYIFNVEKLGLGKITKYKFKGKALGQIVSINLFYTPTYHPTNFWGNKNLDRNFLG